VDKSPHAPQVGTTTPTPKAKQQPRHSSNDTMLSTYTRLSFCALFHVVAAIASLTFEQRCLAFQPEFLITDATRNILEYVPAGTKLSFPDNDATCNRGSQAVSANLCRIALSVKTSNDSSIAFEAWLPENWTGRFLATGNGGIDGCE
jgi:feruloyl esterase